MWTVILITALVAYVFGIIFCLAKGGDAYGEESKEWFRITLLWPFHVGLVTFAFWLKRFREVMKGE